MQFQGADTISAAKFVGYIQMSPNDVNWVGSKLSIGIRTGDTEAEIANFSAGVLTMTGAIAATSSITSSGGGIGFTTGNGGAVTQLTSKATATPAINKQCGTVTTHNASLASLTNVSFTLSNSTLAVGDRIVCVHESGGTLGAYNITAIAGAGSGTITIRNITAGSLSEALVIGFVVIKAVTS